MLCSRGCLRPDKPYGHTIEDGRLRYWSASSLTLGDNSTGDGCLRKWWYEKIGGKKAPQTKAQTIGVELHAQVEKYLKTGENGLGSLASRGKHMIPSPGDDLLVEHNIVVPLDVEAVARDAEMEGRLEEADDIRYGVPLEEAPLQLLGIPVIGFIDLAHFRGTNQGALDVQDSVDPPNTGEVCDWKTTGNVKYIKSPSAMSKTIQMTIYGKWMLKVMPSLEHVRLSHGYFVTQGTQAPRKVSLRVIPQTLNNQWEHVERVGRSILDVIGVRDADDVPPNTEACGAFGGCAHKSYCRAGGQNSLAKLFGPAGAARIAERARNRVMTTTAPLTLGRRGGLLGLRKTEVAGEDTAKIMAELAKEEAQAKYPLLEGQWAEFIGEGLGVPPLSGDFAKVISDLLGIKLVEGCLPGSGEFSTTEPFNDPDEMPGMLEDVRGIVASRAAPPAIVPDIAAEEAPKKKRGRPPKVKSEEGAKAPSDSSVTDGAAVDLLVAKLDVESVVAAPGVLVGVTPVSVAAPGVLVGVNTQTDYSSMSVFTGTTLTMTPSLKTPSSSPVFYINCYPSCSSQSYWAVVRTVMAEMAAEAGLYHIAQAPTGHELAFGKWKYAVHLALQMENVTTGHWTMETTSSELSAVVLEAVRENCARRGWIIVEASR